VDYPAAMFDADVGSAEVGERTSISSVADATTTVADDVEVKTTRSGRQVITLSRYFSRKRSVSVGTPLLRRQ
jgi:hypothetical protein